MESTQALSKCESWPWAYGKGWQVTPSSFNPGPSCPTLLRPAGGPTLKRAYGHFSGDLLVGQAAGGRLLLFWTPHAVHL
jgi:hypothetical protein